MILCTEQVLSVGFSSISLWTSFYFFMRLLRPSRSGEWICREVTVFHATIITILSAITCLMENWPFTDPAGPNTPLQTLITAISFGYFVFDLSWCLIHQTEGPLMLAHHSLSLTGIAVTLYRQTNGAELACTLAGTEVTNPLLQARWFLKMSGHADTNIYDTVELVFLISFGVVRLGAGTCLLVFYMPHPRPDFWAKLAGGVIYSIGVFFFILLVRYYRYKQEKRSRKSLMSKDTVSQQTCESTVNSVGHLDQIIEKTGTSSDLNNGSSTRAKKAEFNTSDVLSSVQRRTVWCGVSETTSTT